MTDRDVVSLKTGCRDGWGVRVVFERKADRYAHEIQCFLGHNTTSLLCSLEGGADRRWPESPPLQQLSIEERGDGSRLALLVGMAGQSHWSASVHAEIERPRVEFDIACLARESPTWLGSSYRLERASRAADPSHASLVVPLQTAAVEQATTPRVPDASSPAVLHGRLPVYASLVTEDLVGESSSQLTVSQGLACVTCSVESSSFPNTFRWKYALELEVD